MKGQTWKKTLTHSAWALGVIVMVGWASGSKANSVDYTVQPESAAKSQNYVSWNDVSSEQDNRSRIYVMNPKGQIVRILVLPSAKGLYKTFKYQLQETLSNGTYTVIVEENGDKQFKKMTVRK